MGDVEHGDLEFVADAAQVGENFCFEFGIETTEGFVEEEQAGRGEEGAGEGHALLFATGDFGDAAVEERFDFQGFHDVRGIYGSPAVTAVGDVAFHGKMRKKSEILRDVADRSFFRAEMNSDFCVGENRPIEFDCASRQSSKACDQVQEGGFAGAGRSADGGDAMGQIDVQREIESGQRKEDVAEAKHQVFFRNKYSLTQTAANAITAEAMRRRQACESSPSWTE